MFFSVYYYSALPAKDDEVKIPCINSAISAYMYKCMQLPQDLHI